MKFIFDMENKKAEAEADVEKLVEKGMDNHEKNWKEKFSMKHKAKKEIMELKHKQNIEETEHKMKKKGFVKEIIEGINTNKQIELEEKRKLEEEQKRLEEEKIRKEQEEIKRVRKSKKSLGTTLLIGGLLITTIGFGLGTDGSGLQMIGSVGFIGCMVGLVLLIKYQ